MIFFTSDQHFFHKNIINYTDRPYDTIEEMNADIIRKHNEVVKDGDVVYQLGDFSFEKDITDTLSQLNGEHIFVRGNHDRWEGVDDVPWIRDIKVPIEGVMTKTGKPYKQKIALCHYPMRSWNSSYHGSYHLYGHAHGNVEETSTSLDVGIDCWDYYPVSFTQIMSKLRGSYEVS
jgi:calcineurin-like phosphoesterase family protein